MIDPSESRDLLESASHFPWWLGYSIGLGVGIAWLALSISWGNTLGICFSLAFSANAARLIVRDFRIHREDEAARRIYLDPVTLLPINEHGTQLEDYADFVFKEKFQVGSANGPLIRHYVHRRTGRSLYFSEGGYYWEWRAEEGAFVEIPSDRALAEFYS